MDRALRALAAGLLLAATAAPMAARGEAVLDPPPAVNDRIELSTLLFPREPPARLLREHLRISGIDPEDIRITLEALNRRSELAQFTPDGLAVAPYALPRMLSLDPGTTLQFRFSGRAGKLVLRFAWP